MAKTEAMIHKQAIDSAWGLLKFYSRGYNPQAHRAHADQARQDLNTEQKRIDNKDGEGYDRFGSNWQREQWNQAVDDRNAMLEEHPDLEERTVRTFFDTEPRSPNAREYNLGSDPKYTGNRKNRGGYATPDRKSVDPTEARARRMSMGEGAEGEDSFRTQSTGDSIFDIAPGDSDKGSWLKNPGNDPSQMHPMYHNDNRQSLMNLR